MLKHGLEMGDVELGGRKLHEESLENIVWMIQFTSVYWLLQSEKRNIFYDF